VIKKGIKMSEPVALRYDFDGHGYLYMDAGSGSDWASRVKNCEFLYTHPQKELTDKEIMDEWYTECCPNGDLIKFARAILKKASEK
jgi:hypothetical protein